jgi:hypothetical protein
MIPISTYIYAGLFALVIAGFGYGRYQHNILVEYKAEVKAIAEKQKTHIESITKQQSLVTKGIENEYNAKLALLRQYYANNGMHNTSSGAVPTISNATTGFDAITAYNLLVGQCAEATQQLVSLQDWLNAQIGIK